MTFDFWNGNKKKVKKIFCPVTDFITFEKKNRSTLNPNLSKKNNKMDDKFGEKNNDIQKKTKPK